MIVVPKNIIPPLEVEFENTYKMYKYLRGLFNQNILQTLNLNKELGGIETIDFKLTNSDYKLLYSIYVDNTTLNCIAIYSDYSFEDSFFKERLPHIYRDTMKYLGII